MVGVFGWLRCPTANLYKKPGGGRPHAVTVPAMEEEAEEEAEGEEKGEEAKAV